MNWDDLRYFLALARAGTVSAAGRELKVKHTTVARRIKALEARLGSRLFDHLADGYALTPAGENLYPHALVMEEQALAVDREVFGLDTQLQGSLKLTASYDVLGRLVIPHLGQFKKAYPGIDLQLLGSSVLADLSARQADIALRLTPKPPDYLIGKKLLPLRHGVYASEQYLKQNSKPGHVILWNDDQKRPDWMRDHFPKAEVVIRVDDVTNMLASVRSHLGLARIPCYIGENVEDLYRLDLPLTPSTWGVWVLSHVDLRATARVRACREFLVDIIEQQRGLIEGLDSRYWHS
jgi:DNA-binding transcriptional LysR family regulator